MKYDMIQNLFFLFCNHYMANSTVLSDVREEKVDPSRDDVKTIIENIFACESPVQTFDSLFTLSNSSQD